MSDPLIDMVTQPFKCKYEKKEISLRDLNNMFPGFYFEYAFKPYAPIKPLSNMLYKLYNLRVVDETTISGHRIEITCRDKTFICYKLDNLLALDIVYKEYNERLIYNSYNLNNLIPLLTNEKNLEFNLDPHMPIVTNLIKPYIVKLAEGLFLDGGIYMNHTKPKSDLFKLIKEEQEALLKLLENKQLELLKKIKPLVNDFLNNQNMLPTN